MANKISQICNKPPRENREKKKMEKILLRTCSILWHNHEKWCRQNRPLNVEKPAEIGSKTKRKNVSQYCKMASPRFQHWAGGLCQPTLSGRPTSSLQLCHNIEHYRYKNFQEKSKKFEGFWCFNIERAAFSFGKETGLGIFFEIGPTFWLRGGPFSFGKETEFGIFFETSPTFWLRGEPPRPGPPQGKEARWPANAADASAIPEASVVVPPTACLLATAEINIRLELQNTIVIPRGNN